MALTGSAQELLQSAISLTSTLSAVQNSESAASRSERADVFLEQLPVFLEPRLVREAVSLAALLRNYLFEGLQHTVDEDDFTQASEREVGRLNEDGHECPLILREACHKLLHHQTIQFPVSTAGLAPSLTSRLHLIDCALVEGQRQNGRPWTALVNLHEFAAAAYVAATLWE